MMQITVARYNYTQNICYKVKYDQLELRYTSSLVVKHSSGLPIFLDHSTIVINNLTTFLPCIRRNLQSLRIYIFESPSVLTLALHQVVSIVQRLSLLTVGGSITAQLVSSFTSMIRLLHCIFITTQFPFWLNPMLSNQRPVVK